MTVNELLADPRYQRLTPTLQSQALRAVALGGNPDSYLGQAGSMPTSGNSAAVNSAALQSNEDLVRTPGGMSPQGWQAYTDNSQKIYQSFVDQNIAAGMTPEAAKNTATQQYAQWGQAQHDQMYSDANAAPFGIEELAPLAGNNGLNAPLGVLGAGLIGMGAAGSFGATPAVDGAAAATTTAAGAGGTMPTLEGYMAGGNAAGGLSTSATGVTGLTPGVASATGEGLGSGITSTLAGNAGLTGSVGALSNDALLAGGLGAGGAGAALAAGAAAPAAVAGSTVAGTTGGGALGTVGTTAAGTAAAGAAANGISGSDPAPAPPPSAPGDIQLGNPDPNGGTITGSTQFDPNTGLPTTAANGAAGTALSRILGGNASAADWASVLGTGGATALGMYGANEQANAMRSMYDQYLGLGAPSRTRYEDSFDPNFDVSKLPGLQSALDTTNQSLLRQASIGGNPAGNPSVLAEINKYALGSVALPALQQFRNQNAATGGYGAFNAAAPATGASAVGAAGNVYNAAGYGLGQMTNPMPTLDQFFKNMRSAA